MKKREITTKKKTKTNRTNEILNLLRDAQKNPCVCFNFRKVTRSITQLYDEALKPSGLKGTQFTLLCVTATRQPINFNDIAKVTYSDKTTIARNIKLLEQKGLVSFEPGSDRRAREVRLTLKGQTLLIKAYPLWKGVQDRVKDVMGKNRIDNLLEDLSMTLADIAKV